MPERCDWNPKFNIPATDPVEDGDCANVAVWSVGVRNNWHLCDSCAGLAEFKRMTARVRPAGRKERNGN